MHASETIATRKLDNRAAAGLEGELLSSRQFKIFASIVLRTINHHSATRTWNFIYSVLEMSEGKSIIWKMEIFSCLKWFWMKCSIFEGIKMENWSRKTEFSNFFRTAFAQNEHINSFKSNQLNANIDNKHFESFHLLPFPHPHSIDNRKFASVTCYSMVTYELLPPTGSGFHRNTITSNTPTCSSSCPL